MISLDLFGVSISCEGFGLDWDCDTQAKAYTSIWCTHTSGFVILLVMMHVLARYHAHMMSLTSSISPHTFGSPSHPDMLYVTRVNENRNVIFADTHILS